MAKNILWLILAQVAFVVINIITGQYQARRFDERQRPINHRSWAVAYGAAIAGAYLLIFGLNELRNAFASIHALLHYLVSGEFLFALALLVQRVPVFNTALNYYRKPRRPIFYTNPSWKTKEKNSWFDRLYGNYYPVVFFFCIAVLITLQFFIL